MGKRIVDVFGSLFGLVILSPVLIALMLLIRFKIGKPVFFKQTRPGLNGRSFNMIKFRTMRDAVGQDGNPLPDSERITPFGAHLRAMSLDELPELWNVFIGDMSLVGPRPLLMKYLPLYTNEQARRHEVRPGITGWAQVNGRNAISWEKKFESDVWYVENRNFALDVKILLLTIKRVALKDGISAEGEVTMTAFEGRHETKNERLGDHSN